MIKDCFGTVAQVGDHIAFSQGNAGAKVWEFGEITKITAKSVYFKGRAGGMWRTWSEDTELRRGEGCFVIDKEKRNGDN